FDQQNTSLTCAHDLTQRSISNVFYPILCLGLTERLKIVKYKDQVIWCPAVL
ncbi:hypothetical protein P7K49_005202, partial [Saguinus oedipus]